MPMLDRRQTKDNEYRVWKNEDGTWEVGYCQLTVLMDIRDELKKLNAVLHCPNFLGIPHELRQIKERLPKRRRKKKPPTKPKGNR